MGTDELYLRGPLCEAGQVVSRQFARMEIMGLKCLHGALMDQGRCVAHFFMLVPRQCSFKASTEPVNHPGSDNCTRNLGAGYFDKMANRIPSTLASGSIHRRWHEQVHDSECLRIVLGQVTSVHSFPSTLCILLAFGIALSKANRL